MGLSVSSIAYENNYEKTNIFFLAYDRNIGSAHTND
jgi:hypothetical protein